VASGPAKECFHTLFPDKDRPDIYTTKEMSTKKTVGETMAAAFTDHLALILRISIKAPIVRRGRASWKINSSLLDEVFK
jgi:hypothetical protein